MNDTIVSDKLFDDYVKKYDNFIGFCLKRMMNRGINLDREEIRNLIYEQVWYCIKHHDPEKSAFTTYLYNRCWGALLHHIRDISTHYDKFKTNEAIEKEERKNVIQHHILCKEILDDIPDDDIKESLIMYIMDGYTFREIGEIYNISHVTARSRIKKILEKIRKQHNKEMPCH